MPSTLDRSSKSGTEEANLDIILFRKYIKKRSKTAMASIRLCLFNVRDIVLLINSTWSVPKSEIYAVFTVKWIVVEDYAAA